MSCLLAYTLIHANVHPCTPALYDQDFFPSLLLLKGEVCVLNREYSLHTQRKWSRTALPQVITHMRLILIGSLHDDEQPGCKLTVYNLQRVPTINPAQVNETMCVCAFQADSFNFNPSSNSYFDVSLLCQVVKPYFTWRSVKLHTRQTPKKLFTQDVIIRICLPN